MREDAKAGAAATRPSSEHAVLFYDCDEALCATLVPYLADGLLDGGATVLIATEQHAAECLRRLRSLDVDVDDALHERRLLVLDAAATLASLTVDGSVERASFERVVGALLFELNAEGREIRAYGEMVALLWDAGDVPGAIELETLWNELGERLPFTLLCAYRSSAVDGAAAADARAALCALHTDVHAPHEAALATPDLAVGFACDPGAVAEARRLVAAALRERRCASELIEDAALTTSELTGNAVRHARTAFTLHVRTLASGVRIEVRDFAPTETALRARLPHGLGLIDATASRWGVEPTADGKLVWAELTGVA